MKNNTVNHAGEETLNFRLRAYTYAQAQVEKEIDRPEGSYGVCHYLEQFCSSMYDNLQGVFEILSLEKTFPEFWFFRPAFKSEHHYWWDLKDTASRLKALQHCIDEVNQQLNILKNAN